MSNPCQMPLQLHTSLLKSDIPSVRDYRTPLRVCSAACIFAIAQSRCARAASSHYVAFRREAKFAPMEVCLGGAQGRLQSLPSNVHLYQVVWAHVEPYCRDLQQPQCRRMPCRHIYMQYCSSRRTCWQRCDMIKIIISVQMWSECHSFVMLERCGGCRPCRQLCSMQACASCVVAWKCPNMMSQPLAEFRAEF